MDKDSSSDFLDDVKRAINKSKSLLSTHRQKSITNSDDALEVLRDVLAQDKLSKLPEWVAPCPTQDQFDAYKRDVDKACKGAVIKHYDHLAVEFIISSLSPAEMLEDHVCQTLQNLFASYWQARKAHTMNAPWLALARIKSMLSTDPNSCPEDIRDILRQDLVPSLDSYLEDVRRYTDQKKSNISSLLKNVRIAQKQIAKITRRGIPG